MKRLKPFYFLETAQKRPNGSPDAKMRRQGNPTHRYLQIHRSKCKQNQNHNKFKSGCHKKSSYFTKMELLVEVLTETSNFLDEVSWLFNFPNINIFQEIEHWPEPWTAFLQSLSTSQELKEIFHEICPNNEKVPNFFRDFVNKRNSLLTSLTKILLDCNDEFLEVTNNVPAELKRGMTPKKQHEVDLFSQHVHEQIQRLINPPPHTGTKIKILCKTLKHKNTLEGT